MKIALEEAYRASTAEEVPVGAVAIHEEQIIGKAHNMKEALNDPTAHAELIVIREASRKLQRWRLHDVILYVTLEPCAMCAGAIIQARIPVVVFGAWDLKSGCAGSVFPVLNSNLLNHRVEVIGGVLEEECKTIIQDFFQRRR